MPSTPMTGPASGPGQARRLAGHDVGEFNSWHTVVPASQSADSDNEYPEDWPAEMPENWGEWPA